jgi:hypothetical protein
VIVPVRNNCFAEYGFPITTSVAPTAHRTRSRPPHVDSDLDDKTPARPPRVFHQAYNNSPCAFATRRASTSAHKLGDMRLYEWTLVFCRYVFSGSKMYLLHRKVTLGSQLWVLRLRRPKLRLCLHLHRLQHQKYIRGRVQLIFNRK